MSKERKASSVRARKPKTVKHSLPFADDPELNDFLAWRRVEKSGWLPQGCTPEEKRAYLDAQAEMLGIKPIQDPAIMTARFWPTDETADDLIAAVRALRRQGKGRKREAQRSA